MGAEVQSKMSSYTDDHGCVYRGEVKSGLAHGNGSMECPEKEGNTKYNGEWSLGAFHG